MDDISLIVLGAYTVIYLVVFIIQYNQIKSQKDIISSMKSFIDIFKVDEVMKYTDMRDERIKGDVENFVRDDVRVKEVLTEFSQEKLQEIRNEHKETLEKQMWQMSAVILEFMKGIAPEDRERFIKEQLHLSQNAFMTMLVEIDDEEQNNF